MVRPNRSPRAQTTRPDMSSVRPDTPRNWAWERSATTRFTSPPSACGAAAWATARVGASSSAGSEPRERRRTCAIHVMCGPLLAVEAVHRPFHAFLHPALHRLGHRIEQVVEDLPLLGGEAVEDEVGQVVVIHRPGPQAEPEPGVALAPERALAALEAVVPAGAAGAPEAVAPDVERHVVHQHQQIAGGFEALRVPEGRQHRSAPVHIGLGLDDLNRDATPG